MYIPRNIDIILKDWRTSKNRSPLILRGARQVGKSASVAELGRSFRTYLTADFESSPDLQAIFAESLDPQKIISQMEAILGKRIIPGETLLFFDEIQECPRAISSLRYFKEKMPDLHLIAAGSLLEFVLGEISFPVGRVEYEYLYPLSFSEFLLATKREILAENIPKYRQGAVLPEIPMAIAEALYNSLKEYMIVGGMPEAVVVYRDTNSFVETQKVHDKLIRGFRDDIPKYVTGDLQKRNLSMVFARLAGTVGEQVTYTKLLDDDPKRNKTSVFLLEKAMLSHLVQSITPSGLPLGASIDNKRFKPLFIDIGLMQRLCGRSIQQIMEANDLTSSFQGQLAEQFVGQQLLATGSGSEGRQLYFWSRAAKSSSAEVDFVIVRDGKIIPVEVKSGPSGKLKSLHILLKTYPNVEDAICLQNTKTCSKLDQIHFLPLFSEL